MTETIAQTVKTEGNKIKFLFHPNGFENKQHVVEKADSNGIKRKYVRGIASGTKLDGHGERMTQHCIESFHRQAQTGDILLYCDLHEIAYTEDIGKLVYSNITPEGEWEIECRLYDTLDGFDKASKTLETVDKLWKQMNGLPPYKTAKQKGFSVEGTIPPAGLISADSQGKQRVMDDVILDGVVVVPRPAYQGSIAHSVYKALGLPTPFKIQKSLGGSLQEIIQKDNSKEIYFKQRCQIEDALENEIKKIMQNPVENIQERLEMLFDEYSSLMIGLIMTSADTFDSYDEIQMSVEKTNNNKSKMQQILFHNLLVELSKVLGSIKEKY